MKYLLILVRCFVETVPKQHFKSIILFRHKIKIIKTYFLKNFAFVSNFLGILLFSFYNSKTFLTCILFQINSLFTFLKDIFNKFSKNIAEYLTCRRGAVCHTSSPSNKLLNPYWLSRESNVDSKSLRVTRRIIFTETNIQITQKHL